MEDSEEEENMQRVRRWFQRTGTVPAVFRRIEDNGRMGRKQYFYVYTMLFLLAVCMVFGWYFLTGRTLIWEMDGWKQHYKSLVYYAKYLRSALQAVFSGGQPALPAWDFSIGEGSDVLTAFHYYVIGDPFTLLSAFVPLRFLHLYYEGMVLLRLYLAGIAFSCLCFRTGLRNKCGVLAGSMAYVFCFWALRNAARHPYFLNPMIYFPLLVLGVEKILRERRPYLFSFAVFLSAVSNVYFFYMLVLLTVLYVGARLIASYYRDIKAGLGMLFRIGGASVLGVLPAAAIWLPMCAVLLGDTRVSSGRPLHILYPLSYYGRLPGLLVSSGAEYWLCLGFAVPVLVAMFWFLRKAKKYRFLKALFAICLVIAAFPVLGQALNGFSYVANRWCWAIALLLSYVLAAMWPRLMWLQRKDARFLYLCLTIYLLACVALVPSWSGNTFISLALGYLFVFVLFPVRKGKILWGLQKKQALAMLLVLASIFNNSFWHNTPVGKNYAADCMEREEVKHGLMENETAAIWEAARMEEAGGFWRFSGNRPTQNANVISGLSSTQYYWSISNPSVGSFRKEVELREADTYNYRGYDGRAALLSLAAVRYYAIPKDSTGVPPYGFSRVMLGEREAEYAIYRNEYQLPLAYCYDCYVPKKIWDTLSSVEKQEALLQGVVLEDSADRTGAAGRKSANGNIGVPQAELQFTGQNIYPSVCFEGEGISQVDGGMYYEVRDVEDAKIRLEFQGLKDCETYLFLHGLLYDEWLPNDGQHGAASRADKKKQKQELEKRDEFSWNSKEGIKIGISSSVGEEKTLSYYTEESSHYSGRHDFTVNLGYSQEAVTCIELSFDKPGCYVLGPMGVICQPMGRYGEQIGKLQENTLQNLEIGTDMVTGSISVESPQILCFAIPYSKGWTAQIDGKEAALMQANTMYMAVALEPGTHRVALAYHTPLLKEGIWISICGMAAVLMAACFHAWKKCVLPRKRSRKEARERT